MKITSVEFVKSVVQMHQLPKEGLSEIAFAGRSNVGKSSLINCLLTRKKIAKTSSTPGKTRQLNYFRINDRFYFVDLPGYGFAKVSQTERQRWQKLIEDFVTKSGNLKGIISIIDCKVGPTKLDHQLLEWLVSLNVKVIVVATKCDKLSKNSLRSQFAKITKELNPYLFIPILAFSAVTGTGKRDVWQAIDQLLR